MPRRTRTRRSRREQLQVVSNAYSRASKSAEFSINLRFKKIASQLVQQESGQKTHSHFALNFDEEIGNARLRAGKSFSAKKLACSFAKDREICAFESRGECKSMREFRNYAAKLNRKLSPRSRVPR
jgi:hypothetical protein